MSGIVIHFSKTVYWPIPKNACTTFKVYLANLLDVKMPKSNPHRASFEHTDKSISGYKDWALVRNPYTRFYSLWVNKIAPGHPEHSSFKEHIDHKIFKGFPRGAIFSEMPFEDFAYTLLEKYQVHNSHWDPQCWQFPTGTITQKMEDISVFLQTMFPPHNGSVYRVPYEEAYAPEVKNLVANYYSADFERLGYDK